MMRPVTLVMTTTSDGVGDSEERVRSMLIKQNGSREAVALALGADAAVDEEVPCCGATLVAVDGPAQWACASSSPAGSTN